MGFFKTHEEKKERMEKRGKLKADIQRWHESRRKALQEQYKKDEELRNLYRERIREERRLRESTKSRD